MINPWSMVSIQQRPAVVIIVSSNNINTTTTFQVFHVYRVLPCMLIYLYSQETPEVCHLEIIIFTYTGEPKTPVGKVICSGFMTCKYQRQTEKPELLKYSAIFTQVTKWPLKQGYCARL